MTTYVVEDRLVPLSIDRQRLSDAEGDNQFTVRIVVLAATAANGVVTTLDHAGAPAKSGIDADSFADATWEDAEWR